MLNSAASSSRVGLGQDGDICIDAGILIARYDGLPFTVVAFRNQHTTDNQKYTSRRIRKLMRRLVAHDETFYYLVGESQRK